MLQVVVLDQLLLGDVVCGFLQDVLLPLQADFKLAFLSSIVRDDLGRFGYSGGLALPVGD